MTTTCNIEKLELIPRRIADNKIRLFFKAADETGNPYYTEARLYLYQTGTYLEIARLTDFSSLVELDSSGYSRYVYYDFTEGEAGGRYSFRGIAKNEAGLWTKYTPNNPNDAVINTPANPELDLLWFFNDILINISHPSNPKQIFELSINGGDYKEINTSGIGNQWCLRLNIKNGSRICTLENPCENQYKIRCRRYIRVPKIDENGSQVFKVENGKRILEYEQLTSDWAESNTLTWADKPSDPPPIKGLYEWK